MSFALRVARDEPERLLVLEADPVSMPGGRMVEVVGGLAAGLLRMAGAADSDRLWYALLLRADRSAGTLEIRERHIFDGDVRSASIPLAHVVGLSVRTRFVGRSTDGSVPPPGPDNPRHLELTVRVEEGRGGAPSRALRLAVAGVDTLAEVADLAQRLGAAMGLAYQRVLRCDPRRIEIEMAGDPEPGMEAIPPLDGPADYARDVVAPRAARAAAQERIPPFDSSRFASDARLTSWSPGADVRFEKALDWTALGCLPFVVVGPLAGPALFAFTHDWGVTAFVGGCGLLAGLFGSIGLAMGLPRRVRIAWSEQAITVRGLFLSRRVPFHRLAALEVRCVRSVHTQKHSRYNTFRCDVLAHLVEESAGGKPLLLVATTSVREDPEAPYDQALPLATELAASLGVLRRVTDYR